MEEERKEPIYVPYIDVNGMNVNWKETLLINSSYFMNIIVVVAGITMGLKFLTQIESNELKVIYLIAFLFFSGKLFSLLENDTRVVYSRNDTNKKVVV